MKVLVIGYGSMGRRRIRLLKKLVPDAEIECVDSNQERYDQIKKDGYKRFQELDEAIKSQPDMAFVCTSPGNHAGIILRLLDSGINVFTELNLIDTDYDDIIKLSKEKKLVVFMSSTMLYNRQIAKIGELVNKSKKPLMYIYHVGQYLPDWHPWENYKDFFVGKKETNGIREIYAIQLPWIINAFGKISSISSYAQHCTDLDIDFPDSMVTNFKHKNGNIGIFAADIVSRKATTNLEIIGEDLHIFWGGHNDDLFIYDIESKEKKAITLYDQTEHIEGYADNIVENPYLDELADFLDAVIGNSVPRYSLEQDKYTLSVINEIERTKQ